jgi:hypothetical protein
MLVLIHSPLKCGAWEMIHLCANDRDVVQIPLSHAIPYLKMKLKGHWKTVRLYGLCQRESVRQVC